MTGNRERSGKVVVTGATGFIGAALVPALVEAGYDVVALVRGETEIPGARTVRWDAKSRGEWERELDGAVGVINLAGEPISQRLTPQAKDRIVTSRRDAANAIRSAIEAAASAPATWINASAIGFYGSRGSSPVDEASLPGTGFIAETTQAWEEAVLGGELSQTRRTCVRIGVVLGPDGGALSPLERLARLGLGGPAGSGNQGFSWIHRHDLVEIFLWLLETPNAPSVVNGTAPTPVSNREFMKQLRRVLGVPIGIPAPSFGVKLIGATLGPDPELVLGGAFVMPRALQTHGFEFSYPELEPALRQILKR